MLRYLASFIVLAFFVSCNANHNITNKGQLSYNESKEEIAIHKVVGKVYSSFKVEKGEQPDFTYIKTLFTPNARLGFIKNDSLVSYSIDEYLKNMETGISKNKISLLKEWEIKGKTEQFGDIAHRISTYGVYVNTTDKLAERGIISYQLVKINGKWLVLSMIWEAENTKLKIPAKYDL